MNPLLRAFSVILLGCLGVSVFSLAQSKPPRPDDKSTREEDGAGGTMVRKSPVKNNDDVVQLQVRSSNQPAEVLMTNATAGSGIGTAQDPEKAKAEIVVVQKEIKNKQLRVEFLMRMFNTDERKFLIDPSAQTPNDDVQAKRRFEQEELHREAAEIAQLRARLELLLAAVGEKAPPVIP